MGGFQAFRVGGYVFPRVHESSGFVAESIFQLEQKRTNGDWGLRPFLFALADWFHGFVIGTEAFSAGNCLQGNDMGVCMCCRSAQAKGFPSPPPVVPAKGLGVERPRTD